MLLLLACHSPDAPVVATSDPEAPRVVVIVVDGVRLQESFGDQVSSITGAPTAELLPEVRARLFPDATVIEGALSSGVPITTEAHTELFTGLRQDLATFPPGEADTYLSDVPTIFEAFRAASGADAEQVVMVVNTVLVEDLAWSAWPDLGERFGATHRFTTDDAGQDLSDAAILGSLRTWMENHDTRLAFANLHGIDQAGHVGEGTAYIDRIEQVDDHLAAFWEWLRDTAPYAGHTTLIVLADHGRHDSDEEESWRGHGDQCTGCRSIPLLFAGPGIAKGETLYTAPTLPDVAQTVAHLLDAPLRMGRGRPIAEVLGAPVEAAPILGVAAAGSHRAWEEDGVLLDGARVSSPDAIHAEAPVLAEVGGHLVACWRELGPDGAWVGRCTRDGEDLGFPDDVVSARWSPAIFPEGESFWLGWAHNPNSYTGSPGVRPRVARWDGTWHPDAEAGPETSLPTHVSLSAVGKQLRVAFAASGHESAGRDTRQVEVWAVETGAIERWRRLERYAPDEQWSRLESPSLHHRRVAMIAYGTGTTVLLGEGGRTTRLDPTGRVLGHLGATWDGEDLVWARLGTAETIELCRWDGVLKVVDTGARAITGLAPTDTGWVATLDGEVVEGEW